MSSLPALPFVRALVDGRAPAFWRSEMTALASCNRRVSGAASWLRRFQAPPFRLVAGPLLGATLTRLMGRTNASTTADQVEAEYPGLSDGVTRARIVTLPEDRTVGPQRASIAEGLAGRRIAIADTGITGRPKPFASIRDLERWAATPASVAFQTRASQVKPPLPAATKGMKVASPETDGVSGERLPERWSAAIRHGLKLPPIPAASESCRHWSDHSRRRAEAVKQTMAVELTSVRRQPLQPAGSEGGAATIVNTAEFVKRIATGCAPGELLARCLRDASNAPELRQAARPGGIVKAERGHGDISGNGAPAIAQGREPAELNPAASEYPRIRTTWAGPPREQSEDSATPSAGVWTSGGRAVADDEAALTAPVSVVRGFEPGKIIAPRLIKGGATQYPAARIQSEAEPHDEDLSVLAEQIKQILDEEARRHGIPV